MTNIFKEIKKILRAHGKGIKSFFFSKYGSIQHTNWTLPEYGDTITNPYYIANTFNNYLASIVEITKKSIKYSHKNVSDYLSNESGSTIFL